jgi:Flp pilus assembly protein TadB
VEQGANVEPRSGRTTDALTWAAAGCYAVGLGLFIVVVLAGALVLLWLVLVLVVGGVALSVLIELRRRRKREPGREAWSSHHRRGSGHQR